MTGGRRIFVGDIQGCREELELLLDAAGFERGRDELHPVGDFVNRGPDSLGTLRLARELGAGGVLGNHDLHLLRAAAGTRPERPGDSFDDVLAAPDRDELLAWLAARPFARQWPDVFLVHAGVDPTWTDPLAALAGLDPLLQDPASDFATRVRFCAADGRRPELEDAVAAPDDPAYRPWYEHTRPAALAGRTIVFGHWSVRGLVERPGLRGLDTGCVWGRQLTAWIAEEDRIVQVDALAEHCPVDS